MKTTKRWLVRFPDWAFKYLLFIPNQIAETGIIGNPSIYQVNWESYQHHQCSTPKTMNKIMNQGILTEWEGSVQLTSSLR
jgi:hypothetical protein